MIRNQQIAGLSIAALMSIASPGAATAQAPVAATEAICPPGANHRLVVELLFGQNIGLRPGVSNAAFHKFLDREVTPRFPDGFTLIDTYGQYRTGPTGAIAKEKGKYLLIALGDQTRDLPRAKEITEVYKRRFRQQSVGMITRTSCVSF